MAPWESGVALPYLVPGTRWSQRKKYSVYVVTPQRSQAELESRRWWNLNFDVFRSRLLALLVMLSRVIALYLMLGMIPELQFKLLLSPSNLRRLLAAPDSRNLMR